MAKIVFSPKMPGPIMDRAREMVPDGFELVVIEQGSAEFAGAMADAEYFMGFARLGLGPDFYRAAPKLKLVQLISAGYDRCDLEAARKAREHLHIAAHGEQRSAAFGVARVGELSCGGAAEGERARHRLGESGQHLGQRLARRGEGHHERRWASQPLQQLRAAFRRRGA